MNKKVIFAFSFAVLLTGFSWFFVGEDTIFGSIKSGLVYRGFPFHYFEANGEFGTEFLLSKFFINALFYLAIVLSWVYLILLKIKESRIFPLLVSVSLGLLFLAASIFDSTGCVSGFPVEFYVRCMGDSDISNLYKLYGWILDSTFWLCMAALLVASIHGLFSTVFFKQVLKNKNILYGARSAWLIITALSLLGLIGDMDELVPCIILAFAGWPALRKLKNYYQQNIGPSRKVFYSSLSYIIAGGFIGFAAGSFIFNLFYNGGWFDFTDAGFYLLSLPTWLLFNFKFDNSDPGSKLLLYAIVFLNFFVVVYAVDLAVYLANKIFKSVKNLFLSIFYKSIG